MAKWIVILFIFFRILGSCYIKKLDRDIDAMADAMAEERSK